VIARVAPLLGVEPRFTPEQLAENAKIEMTGWNE
jgi:hypothetical protein